MKSGSRRRTRKAPALDILVESPLWTKERGITAVLHDAIVQAASATGREGELAIVLSDDAAIRALNRHWRRKDRPTNVLSFPAAPSAEGGRGQGRRGSPPGKCCLGDIVIAYETAAREAKAERKPFRNHVVHLAVHGFLHLVGYDHEADAEASVMEGLEIAVLARLGVPNPYIAPARSG